MKWINVEDEHFVDITNNKDGSYAWVELYSKPFLVAINTNSGWEYEKVILDENAGLLSHSNDDESGYFGWDIKDVKFWAKFIEPEVKYENKICPKANQCAVTPGGLKCPKERVVCPL